jgi:hypothetical protein
MTLGWWKDVDLPAREEPFFSGGGGAEAERNVSRDPFKDPPRRALRDFTTSRSSGGDPAN